MISEADITEMLSYFDALPSEQATYTDFYPLAKELILRVYRAKDPSEVKFTLSHNICTVYIIIIVCCFEKSVYTIHTNNNMQT